MAISIVPVLRKSQEAWITLLTNVCSVAGPGPNLQALHLVSNSLGGARHQNLRVLTLVCLGICVLFGFTIELFFEDPNPNMSKELFTIFDLPTENESS